MPNSWAGRTAVVTGAGNGIGKAIATRLVQADMHVLINDIDAEAAAAAAEELGAHAVPGDAASTGGAVNLVQRARELVGDIDVWFGNAGVERGRSLLTAEADWAVSHEVNVMAHVRAARLLMPRWVERGTGRYVVTASAAGMLTLLEGPAYAVTKHAAVAFAEWLSATYRHRGIVVQALCPQGVVTNMLAQTGNLRDVVSRDTALSPEQVAESVWAAMSSDSFYVLPHPQVAEYYARRANDPDAWLAGMNGLQRKLETISAPPPAGPRSDRRE